MDHLDKKRDHWRQQCNGAEFGFGVPMIALTRKEMLELLDRLDEAEEQSDLNHKKWEAAEYDANYWRVQNEDRRKEIDELVAEKALKHNDTHYEITNLQRRCDSLALDLASAVDNLEYAWDEHDKQRERAEKAEADAKRWMKKEWEQQQRAFVAEEKLKGVERMKWPEESHQLQQERNALLREVDDLQRMIDEHYAPRAIEAEHRANKEIGRLGNRLGEERAHARKIEFEMEELVKATEWRLDKERKELNLYQQAVNDLLNDGRAISTGIRSQRLGLLAKHHDSWKELRDRYLPKPTEGNDCSREVLWWKCSLNPDHDGECEWVYQP